MVCCGLDVAMVSSYLPVTDGCGKKLMAGSVATDRRALRERLGPFARRGLRVAIEAGGQTARLHGGRLRQRPYRRRPVLRRQHVVTNAHLSLNLPHTNALRTGHARATRPSQALPAPAA